MGGATNFRAQTGVSAGSQGPGSVITGLRAPREGFPLAQGPLAATDKASSSLLVHCPPRLWGGLLGVQCTCSS